MPRFLFSIFLFCFVTCIAQENLFEPFASGTPEMVVSWLQSHPTVDLNATMTEEDDAGTVFATIPLITAADQNENPEVIKLLIEAGADVNVGSNWTPLIASARNPNINVLKLILDFGANVQDQGADALRNAARYNNVEAVKLLLSRGVNVNDSEIYSGTALNVALDFKYSQVVKVLLDAGATIAEEDYLTASDSLEVFQLLLEVGEPLTKETAAKILLRGVRDERITPMLLATGVEVNVRDEAGNTPLMRTTLEGMKLLLDAGADVNATSKTGDTALMGAVDSCYGVGFSENPEKETLRYLEAIKLLLEAGANVNAQTFPEPYVERTHPRQVIRVGLRTALMNAVDRCPSEIPKALLDAGADVNATDQDGETALMKASPGLFDVLLKNGADVNIQDSQGKTVLMQVVDGWGYYEGQEPILFEEILQHGANVNLEDNEGLTVLFYALYECKPEMFHKLHDAGGDLKAQTNEGETLLMYAANFCPEIVQELIDAGLDINAKAANGWSPLTYAYSARATQLLLNAGADVRAFGGQALIEAMKKDNIPRITVLVEAGADVNYVSNEANWFSVYNLPLIVYAVQQNNVELIRLLAEYGANLEARDDSGHTALHWAGLTYNRCTKEFSIATLEMIRVLVAAGADVNARVLPPFGEKYYCQELSNVSDTPLIQAVRRGDIASIQFLLNVGADISAKDNNGWTALDLAVQTQQQEIVKVLLEASQQ